MHSRRMIQEQYTSSEPQSQFPTPRHKKGSSTALRAVSRSQPPLFWLERICNQHTFNSFAHAFGYWREHEWIFLDSLLFKL